MFYNNRITVDFAQLLIKNLPLKLEEITRHFPSLIP